MRAIRLRLAGPASGVLDVTMSKKFYETLAMLSALAFSASLLTIAAQVYGLLKGGPFEWFGSGGTTLVVLILGGAGLAALTDHFQRAGENSP